MRIRSERSAFCHMVDGVGRDRIACTVLARFSLSHSSQAVGAGAALEQSVEGDVEITRELDLAGIVEVLRHSAAALGISHQSWAAKWIDRTEQLVDRAGRGYLVVWICGAQDEARRKVITCKCDKCVPQHLSALPKPIKQTDA